MHGVHEPAAEREARCAAREQERRIGSGTTAAALPHVSAGGEVVPLRCSLAQVATSGVEQLGGVPRERERRLQRHQLVRSVSEVGHRQTLGQDPADTDLQVGIDADPRLLVLEAERRRVLIGAHVHEVQQQAETRAVLSMAFDPRRSRPAARCGGHDCQSDRGVEASGDPLRSEQECGVRAQAPEGQGQLRTPVQDRGSVVRLQLDQHAGAVAPEV